MSLRPTRTFYGSPGPALPSPARSAVAAMLLPIAVALADPVEFAVTNAALSVVVRVVDTPDGPVATVDHQSSSCLSPSVPHAHVWRGGEWSCLGAASRGYTSWTRRRAPAARRCV